MRRRVEERVIEGEDGTDKELKEKENGGLERAERRFGREEKVGKIS